MKRRELGSLGIIVLTVLGMYAALHGSRVLGQAASDKQAVLGPGLYVFQTRIRNSTCGDAEPDGYVLSYYAAVDGVPGATKMSMQLVNSRYFVDWALTVSASGQVLGESHIGAAADAPETHIDLALDKDRWKGTGSRSYNGKLDGKPQRCRVNYDALLRRIDI